MELPGNPLTFEEVKKHLNQMQYSVDGSLQLIDTILYWYHSQDGTIKPSKKALSISTLLEAAIAVYRPVAEKKRIAILHQQDPSRVVADEDMLSVVIRNLLSNAIKFSPQGASIHIFTEKLGDQVWLRIRDEGDGIEEEILKQINLRGQVVSKKGTMHEKGTGLGLALVFRFLKQNDIPIEVETLPGKGTTFLLKLPSVQSSGVS
jgi:signal transduction histidine kinase